MTRQHGIRGGRQLGIRARLGRLRPAQMLPKETRRHLRNVAREQLLALRSLLDAGIARLEETGGKRT